MVGSTERLRKAVYKIKFKIISTVVEDHNAKSLQSRKEKTTNIHSDS